MALVGLCAFLLALLGTVAHHLTASALCVAWFGWQTACQAAQLNRQGWSEQESKLLWMLDWAVHIASAKDIAAN
jgi:hypothetical protein